MMIATGILMLVVVAGIIALWAWRYTKAGPNEVLIISGRKRKVVDPDGRKRIVGYRLVRGGAFVWPILERVQRLSLELLTIEIQTADAYTAQGVRMVVDAVAQVKVKGDEASIALAAEQFLSRSRDDIRRVALQVIEGHLRAVLGTMSVEDLYLRRAEFARQVREAARQDLERMGLDILSLTVRHIADEQGYLDAIGRPRIAQVRQQAAVAEAEADRVARIARLEAERAVEEARRELEARRAEADMAYELHRHRAAQAVKREEMAVHKVEKELAIEIEEKEIERKQRELAATVELPAEAEKRRILSLADAERYRLEAEALGHAEHIRATGRAEAEAMRAKAAAWREYNEAAMAQMVVDILPSLARAMAEPLAHAERIILIGDGHGGVSRFTGDLAQALAQLPILVEALTGVHLSSTFVRNPAASASKEPSD
ncbi:Inner membrane protein YqiK [Candidatus Thermoflexus japonica]|uniref:Inner membrane protein YqiK n=1 Tax=Candidatus Thermoflexus japonica TaxID=2035417 RepID=A0A2H5Y7P6_9CHLR|nr:Inner membrane protein YqiK [Candidatus Thermoflexus japonica]